MRKPIFSCKPSGKNVYSQDRLVLGIYENTKERKPNFLTSYLRGGWDFSEKRKKEIALSLKGKSPRESLHDIRQSLNKLSSSKLISKILNK